MALTRWERNVISSWAGHAADAKQAGSRDSELGFLAGIEAFLLNHRLPLTDPS